METLKYHTKIYDKYHEMLSDIEDLQDKLTLIPNYSEVVYQSLQKAIDEIDEVLYKYDFEE